MFCQDVRDLKQQLHRFQMIDNVRERVQALFSLSQTFSKVVKYLFKSALLSMKNKKNVRAHCYCASLLRTQIHTYVMHLAHREDGHCYTALRRFNDLGRSVTPTFLSRNRFHLQLSTPHFDQKRTKIQRGKLNFFSRFHGT